MAFATCHLWEPSDLETVAGLDAPWHRAPPVHRRLMADAGGECHQVPGHDPQSEALHEGAIGGYRGIHEEAMPCALCPGGQCRDGGWAFALGSFEPLKTLGVADDLNECTSRRPQSHGFDPVRTLYVLGAPHFGSRIAKADRFLCAAAVARLARVPVPSLNADSCLEA